MYLKHIVHRDILGDKRDVVTLQDTTQHLLYLAWQADHSIFDEEVVEQEIVRSASMEGDTMESNTVKTSFTMEVTLRKSGVESRRDLASPYVVHPCLYAGPIFQVGWR